MSSLRSGVPVPSAGHTLVPKWDSRYRWVWNMTSGEAAREVVATVIRRNIEIAEAGALGARYRDLLHAAEVLDEQANIWRRLLAFVEAGE